MPKRVLPLTDLQVKNAKPKDKPYKLTDGGGLYVLITPSGGKLWRFDYAFEDKRKTLFLKSYPEITLSEARQRRDEARRQIATGTDPNQEKKAAIGAAETATASFFEVVAGEWF